MGKMQRTKLVWDDYMDYLIDAINESKFMKRAEDKPMATPKTSTESHVTTRAIHLRESAYIAKRIAKGLGLNADYIHAAMSFHDAGHPFSAHEGEEIFNQLGEIYNTQYFHHNAKGVEIILSEDICGKAIRKIPNIESKPELRKQLEDEFVYFLDAVISHDGEASPEDMMKQETPYRTMNEALQNKMRLANGENKYKFIAQTPEGKIAKFADVIAYLSSDMQDGFRLGILKGFSDDYYALFGEMFSEEYPVEPEDKIECGKRFIEKIKAENLREKEDAKAFMLLQNVDMQFTLKSILDKIKESGLVLQAENIEAIQAIFEQEKQAYRKRKIEEFFRGKEASIPEEQREELEEAIAKKTQQGVPLDETENDFVEELNAIETQLAKIEEFGTKMLRTRSSVVYELTSRMKEYFINDLIKNSQNQDTPQFSNAAWNLFFRAKKLNYQEYVQYTNWDYQTQGLPQAAKDLTEKCAESLVKSGAIRNKFYDPAVCALISDEDVKKYMKTKYRPSDTYTSYRKENGIGDLKAFAKPSKGTFTGSKEQYELMKLFGNVYSYVQNEEEVFAIRAVNTFYAIKNRVRRKIEKALSETPKVDDKHLYQEALQTQIDGIRQEVACIYGTINITPVQKEEFIKAKIDEELNTMEEKIAIQLASDYLAGMTDKSFIEIAQQTGVLAPEVIQNGERGVILSDSVQVLIDKMEENSTGLSAPNRSR